MSGPTATEKATASIPGTENMNHVKENALLRAYNYPVVHDTLQWSHSYLESHRLTSSLYHRASSLAESLLAQLQPLLEKRLAGPLHAADGYANAALDFVEKKVPQVKMETGELLGKARQPADQAYEYAQGYKNGIQQRISPVTDQIAQQLERGQKQLTHLQERLGAAVAAGKDKLPHDQASLNKTLESIQSELDGYAKAAGAIPKNVQDTAQPLFDGIKEAALEARKEISKKDVPLGQRAANILQLSQERITPVLADVQKWLGGKKKDAEQAAGEAKDQAGEKAGEVKDKAKQ
ncbi:hypothetical protein JCM10207_000200 [Rhodosporidiobolus poonsookiae]